MLEKLHEHTVGELQQGARTDTVFVITAVVFNLVVLGVNAAVAGEAAGRPGNGVAGDITLAIFIAMTFLVNGIAIAALSVGRSTRQKLLGGLIAMYRDQSVDKFYDSSLLANYGTRYRLFTGVILCLAATAVLVPLVIRFL